MDIPQNASHPLAPNRPHHPQSVFDFGQTPLAEQIKLVKPQILGRMHVQQSRRKPFGRKKTSGVTFHRKIRNQYTAGMNTMMRRHPLHTVGIMQNQTPRTIQHPAIRTPHTCQSFDLITGKAKDLAQFTDRRTMLITNMGSQKSHVGKSTKNILQHRIPILPRKIQIKIGRVASV